MLEATLALATIIKRFHIESLDDDLPVAVPLGMVAAGPIHARPYARNTVALKNCDSTNVLNTPTGRCPVRPPSNDMRK